MCKLCESNPSLTSDFKRQHDHKCLCQICICNNPNHRCPLQNHKNNRNMKTTHQKDYIEY